MPDGIAPARSSGSEVGVIVQYVLVNVGEHELPFGGAKYRHRYQTDVAVLWLRLFWLKRALLQQRHGQSEPGRVRCIAWRGRVKSKALGYGVVVELQAVVIERGGGYRRRLFRQGPGALCSAAHVA